MRFDPDKKEDPNPPEPGVYHWICTDASEGMGKAGGYVKVVLSVSVPGRSPITVTDWLSESPKMLWKVEQFCKVTGLNFSEGYLSEFEVKGKEGAARFDFGRTRDDGRKFLEVREYLPISALDGAVMPTDFPENAPAPAKDADEIPF